MKSMKKLIPKKTTNIPEKSNEAKHYLKSIANRRKKNKVAKKSRRINRKKN
jgi:hypothetical protein